MGFDGLAWLLVGLPVAFALGWLASRLDVRQLKIENRRAPKAYFRGLNHLLNEQQDQAVDAFVEAVQSDPDTSELHFALGNLFRRRGDYDRAVRVHEHLIARGDLSQAERQRAQLALAQDYWKAGLLDRAEAAFTALLETPLAVDARVALLAIFERSRDWGAALLQAQALDAMACAGQLAQHQQMGSLAGRMAHYLCEQAAVLPDDGALKKFEEAQALAPHLPRVWLDAAKRAASAPQALALLQQLAAHAPQGMPLAASTWVQLTPQLPDADAQAARAALDAAAAAAPSLDLMEARAALAADTEAARAVFAEHLEAKPSLVAATRWMALERLEHEQFHPQVQRALDRAVEPLVRYRCAACGFDAKGHFWQCPACQTWDGIPALRVEETA